MIGANELARMDTEVLEGKSLCIPHDETFALRTIPGRLLDVIHEPCGDLFKLVKGALKKHRNMPDSIDPGEFLNTAPGPEMVALGVVGTDVLGYPIEHMK